MELKNYEFNAHGVDMGQFYESTAIVGDGSVKPPPARGPELYFQPSTVPGDRLPHVWVGEAWAEAAAKAGAELAVPLETVVIGPGREVTDIYYDWARIREIDEDGALLIRPDKHIGWRSMNLPPDPESSLRAALRRLLSR
ncbi:MAG TPA: hypothetical protein VG164_16025 [Trebonia sp.]|jgi:2,4-dichlorophenol 6-monooxygenase|nr:hypothetical protein [Trebonia sp.]